MVENVERHIHRQASVPGGDRCRARAGRSDHRDDDHAGRGLRAGRGVDRRAVPRVRVHPRRRRDRLRCRRADAVADDGREAPALRAERARLRRLDQPAVRRAARRVYPSAGGHAPLPAGRPRLLGDRGPADGALLHVLAAGAGARRGPGRRVLDSPDVRQLHDRSDQAVRRAGRRGLSLAPGIRRDLPADVSDRRLRRLRDQSRGANGPRRPSSC